MSADPRTDPPTPDPLCPCWRRMPLSPDDPLAALPSAPDQRLRDALEQIAYWEGTKTAPHGGYDFDAHHDCTVKDCPAMMARAALSEATTSPEATLDVAWREAEAATEVQYPSGLGDMIDRKRYDLSVHRVYASRLDMDGNEEYEYEARVTLPGIHYLAENGSTPAAALLALAASLRGPA